MADYLVIRHVAVGEITIHLAMVGESTNIIAMVDETTNPQSHDLLLPERHPQQDIFICDVQDATLKDLMQQLEYPFYSLSKKPETQIRRYEFNGGVLEITPSVKGLATIYDKDILIYCISQIMAKLNRGENVAQTVRINSHELLQFANRGTSGRDYQALKEAIDRLAGTRITTDIKSGGEVFYENFGLIEYGAMKRKEGHDGRLLWCDIKLSDWVFNAIRAKEVLSLNRDYFRLRKPIERRIYELARKHCGHQSELEMKVETLFLKSGSKGTLKEFRRAVRELAATDHLPDYKVQFDVFTDKVCFVNRRVPREKLQLEAWTGNLSADIMQEARAKAPGWDIHYLESEWRKWLSSKGITPRSAEKNFLKFCTSWFAKRGRPQ